MPSDLPKLIKEVRHDVSDWLWHFTRRDNQPFETLKEIISSQHIRGSQDKFCLDMAVCFTEMPLTEAHRQSKVLDEFSYNRFSDYGIGFKKKWISEKGGLPVIYQPDSMLRLLDPSIRWRHCELDFAKSIDFSWQREWRVPAEVVPFNSRDEVIIVVKNEPEAMEVANANWELDPEREEVFFDRIWAYVTHTELASATATNHIDVLLESKRLGDSSNGS